MIDIEAGNSVQNQFYFYLDQVQLTACFFFGFILPWNFLRQKRKPLDNLDKF